MAVSGDEVALELESCIGFSGKVPNGYKVTTCGNYVVYPLGSTVVLKSLKTRKQSFLSGHSNSISCIAMSKDGAYLASGQSNHSGVKADVMIWDLQTAKNECEAGVTNLEATALLHRLRQHTGRVQALGFSCEGNLLASLGGQDDNAVVVWDVQQGRAVCGSPAGNDMAVCLEWLNGRNDRLVTAGNYNMRVWQIDCDIPKMHPMDAKLGAIRRVIQCLSIDANDDFAICGTKTGDLLKVKIDRDPIGNHNDPDVVRPCLLDYSKEKFGKGVKAVRCVLNEETGRTNTLVGAGDGTVCFVNPNLNRVAGRTAELLGGVTSIAPNPNGDGFYVGTDQANRYWCNFNLEAELIGTCHATGVNDVVFPEGCSDLFLTASQSDIRVWNVSLKQELLRIQVPNLNCQCIAITRSGGTIVSGWSDGKIRAFYPESGKLKFVITDAHVGGVTALTLANDDDTRPPWRIISGGEDGRVRVWNVTSSHQAMAISWKEHRSPVTCIKVSRDNSQCISGSADGSCIAWDLERGVRATAMFEPTVFKACVYHPDESQYLTCGSNHMITYWDAYDGSAIRVIDGGEEGMNALDVDRTGERFVSGGDDGLFKLWHYDDGITIGTGKGHSGPVNAVRISPNQETCVSVGAEGGIFIWKMPKEMHDYQR